MEFNGESALKYTLHLTSQFTLPVLPFLTNPFSILPITYPTCTCITHAHSHLQDFTNEGKGIKRVSRSIAHQPKLGTAEGHAQAPTCAERNSKGGRPFYRRLFARQGKVHRVQEHQEACVQERERPLRRLGEKDDEGRCRT